MKVLFLQPKAYFLELGISIGLGIDASWGFVYKLNLRKFIKSFDLVVSCIDHDPNARVICAMARSIGVPTVFLMDGIFDLANATKNPKIVSRVSCLLSEDCYSLIYTPTQAHVNYIARQGGRAKLYLPSRLSCSIEPKELRKPHYKYLVTTAKTAYFDEIEKVALRNILIEIIQVLHNSGEPFAVRIFDQSLLDSIVDKLNFKINNLIEQPFSKVLCMVEALISPPSSILHTASLNGKDVYILNFRDKYSDFLDFGIRFTSGSEFKEIIRHSCSTEQMKVIVGPGICIDAQFIQEAMKSERVNSKDNFEDMLHGLGFLYVDYVKRMVYKALKEKVNKKIFDYILYSVDKIGIIRRLM